MVTDAGFLSKFAIATGVLDLLKMNLPKVKVLIVASQILSRENETDF